MKTISTILFLCVVHSILCGQGEVVFEEFKSSNSPSFENAFAFKNQYGFIHHDENYQEHIWLSDGTPENTKLVAPISIRNKPMAVIQDYIIHAYDYDYDKDTYSLYRTDEDTSVPFMSDVDRFFKMAAIDTLVFIYFDNQIWRTNGFASGTYPIKYYSPIQSEEWKVYPKGDKLYFFNNDSLFATDGSLTGTQYIDIGNHVTQKNYGAEMNGVRYFQGCTDATGCELWRTDGTVNGTYLVKDIKEGVNPNDTTLKLSFNPNKFTTIGNQVFFKGGLEELWVTDGTETGTVQLKSNERNIYENWYYSSHPSVFFNLNGKLIFSSVTKTEGIELWISDGTLDGTKLLKDIMSGMGGGILRSSNYLIKDGYLYFTADDGVHGRELWRTDGTENGTKIILDFIPGIRSSYINFLLSVDDNLFFSAFIPDTDDPKLSLCKLNIANIGNRPIPNYDDDISWFRQIGHFPQISSSYGRDVGGVAIDSDDNSYIAGSSNIYDGKIAFFHNKFELPYNPKFINGKQNYLSKFDKDGGLLWAKYFGGNSHNDDAPFMTLDNADNVIVGSFHWGDAIYDSIKITGDYWDKRIAIAKYSSEGELKWLNYGKTYYSSTYVQLFDIVTDEENNVYFLGELYDGRMNWGNSFQIETENDESTAFLGKISSEGVLQWIQEIPDTLRWRAGQLAIHNHQLTFSLYQYKNSSTSNIGEWNARFSIQQYDTEGNKLWSKWIEASDKASLSDIKINKQGEILLLGEYSGSINLGSKTLPNVDYDEEFDFGWFLAKLDNRGNLIHVLHDPERFIRPYEVILEDEHYYLLGIEYFPTYSYYEGGYDGYVVDDNKRLFVEKYDYLNNLIGEREFHKYGNVRDTYSDNNPSMDIFSDGSILLTDILNRSLDTLSHYTPNYSDYSVMLMKFDLPANFPIKTYPDEEELTLKIAPNPSNGFTNVKIIDAAFEQYELRVFNTMGQMVHFQTKEDNFEYQVLDVRHLANGAYFLHFRNSQGKITTLKYVKM